MYFSLGLHLDLGTSLTEAIDAIRKKYDPTYGISEAHLTVLFPVPARVGEE